MSLALGIFGWSLFALALTVALILDLVGLFGNWIILGAVGIAAVVSGFDRFGGYTLAALLVLAIVGEVIEALAAGAGAARYGGGKGAIGAALVGTILGAILGTSIFPIVGTIVGACVGAFTAATLYELLVSNKGVGPAARTGFGAAMGKVAGMFAKTLVGFVMIFIAVLNL